MGKTVWNILGKNKVIFYRNICISMLLTSALFSLFRNSKVPGTFPGDENKLQ